MKILLVQPPLSPKMMVAGIFSLNEPIALEMIGAGVHNHNVRLLDMRIEPNLQKELRDFNPDIVATTAYTAEVYIANQLLEKVKNYNAQIFTVIGGHHATLVPEDFNKKFIDAIVIGEGETTFKELVDSYGKRNDLKKVKGLAFPKSEELFFTPPRELLQDLDSIPSPNRELTIKYREKYFRGTWQPLASFMVSRGCPYRCDFCAMWKINRGKYRIRCPESTVKELNTIKERYIDFVDDNTFHDVRKSIEIYKAIKKSGIKKIYKTYARSDTIAKYPEIAEKWKEIGMELVLVGFEATSNEELKTRNKSNTIRNNEECIHILQKNEIEIAAYFLVNPNFNKDDFDRLRDYVLEMNLTHPVFTILTPFPGTELFRKRYKEFITYNYEHFDYFHTIFPTKLPLKEFYENFIGLYRATYLSASKNKKKNPVLTEEIIQQFSKNFATIHQL